MAIFGSLVGILGLKTSGWTQGTEKAGQDIDKLNKKTKGFFSDLKSSFGKSSNFGQALKLAAGGGAIAGLKLAAQEVDKFVNKLGELRAEYAKGKITSGQFANGLAEELPIFGEFYQVGEHIGDALRAWWKGTESVADETARLTAATKAETEAQKERAAAILKTKNAQEDFNETLSKATEQNKLAGLTGTARDRYQLEIDTNDKIRALNKRYNVDIEGDKIKSLQKTKDAILVNTFTPTSVPSYASDAYKAKIAAADAARKASFDASQKEKLQAVNFDLGPLLDRQQKLYAQYQNIRVQYAQDAQTKLAGIAQKEWEKSGEMLQKAREQQGKNIEELGKQAQDVVKSSETPMQKFLSDMEKLDILWKANRLTRAQFDQASAGYLKTLDSSVEKPEYKAAETHAVRAAVQIVGHPKLANPQEKLNKTALDQLAEQRKTNKLLEDSAARGEVVFNF